MLWHKVEISEGGAGELQASEIIASFSRLFAQQASSQDVALFETHLRIAPRFLYFTPGAEGILGPILKGNRAVPCERPDAKTVVCLIANGDTGRFFL